MSSQPFLRRSGILNGERVNHAPLHGASIRATNVPDFASIKRYIEFIDTEYETLILDEQNEIYEPVVIDLGKLILECNLWYKNILHFLMLITEDGKYGEFQGDTPYAYLTKQALFNLLSILLENTQEAFLERNLINPSDIQKNTTNRVIFDKKGLTRLILTRGLSALSWIAPSRMIASMADSFREGTHFVKVKENPGNTPNTISLTEDWVEFLVRWVNQQVLFSLISE